MRYRPLIGWIVLIVSGAVTIGVLLPAAPVAGAEREELVRSLTVDDGLVIIELSETALRASLKGRGGLVIRDFPVGSTAVVDLEVERFSVTGPGTRFVLGRKGRPDLPIEFDPLKILLLRGRVPGRPGSHVYLAMHEGRATGYVDLGPGAGRYRISSKDRTGNDLGPGKMSIFRAEMAPGLPPDVPLCGVDDDWLAAEGSPAFPLPGAGAAMPPAAGPRVGLKTLDLAVETDFEYFSLFGDLDAALAYLIVMYGEVSTIYMRDVDTRVQLSFARLWDDPDDLFNDVDPSPLSDFRIYWNANMGSVVRDAAQLFSGRRDYPFGGQAWLSSLCGSFAYSVVGYAMGFFPDPTMPSPYHYDISVTAHELGHNSGTGHTHDASNNIDDCDNPTTTPQRGTIMSYCGQTWSGMNANRDHYFHTRIQQNMEGLLNSVSCVADDCNMNGVADVQDILADPSLDADGNGVPDECEDCNGNLVLDDQDIAGDDSDDLNANGIPDECEPDCNNNGIPDDKDIADGGSDDLYGNGIPDECEPDCNTSGTSDYTEIQADMPLDVDRNTVPDSCQDCDTDGTPDLDALNGAHNAWVASGLTGATLGEFHASVGVLTRRSASSSGALVDEGQDVIVAPDGRVLVSSGADDRVLAFDPAGAYLGDLVSPGSGGLDFPTGLTLAPGDTLLVSSRNTNSVMAYDGSTGAPLGVFVDPGSGGLVAPFGLAIGPNGNLFVNSGSNEVIEYDGQNGLPVRVLVSAADNGGLDQPRGMTFKPDGNLLVASFGTNELLEFHGQTGAPLGKWAQSGTATRLTQVSPWGVRIGPNGNVFMIRTGEDFGSGALGPEHTPAGMHESAAAGSRAPLHLSNAQIYEFDVRNGNFLRTYIGGNDHGHLFPTGFAFVPGWDIDCNLNLLPDSCDIASGFSQDTDVSGIPDECEIDCNGNGELDRLDIIPFGTSFDCNFNLSPDECDTASGASADCTGNGIPDECEADCNGNGIADSCDIDAGSSDDCNGNDIPDECDVVDDLGIGTGWTAGAAGDDASAGFWTRVDPNGTVAQPGEDHTPGPGGFCFVTGQGVPGGGQDAADVDGGRTTLVSPVLALAGADDVSIGYWRWFSNATGSQAGQDVLTIDVSNDGGGSWTNVETVGPTGPQASGGWFFHLFRVADLVAPTDSVVLRFVASDEGGDSTVEAAIDDLVVVDCLECRFDLDCNDGLSCTLETCNPTGGVCESALDTGVCLIGGTCYDGGDLNPADNCENCDPASPLVWSPFASSEVQGPDLQHTGLTRLSWIDQGPGFVYDIVGGDLSVMIGGGGLTGASCVRDDAPGPFWDDPRTDPPVGDGYYYLVRSQNSCGPGTYGSGSSGAERLPVGTCP